jgi:hypothetical protein
MGILEIHSPQVLTGPFFIYSIKFDQNFCRFRSMGIPANHGKQGCKKDGCSFHVDLLLLL